jgi:Flp pilus assembly protein TadD
MGDPELAHRNFVTALNLDPNDQQKIRNLIDRLNSENSFSF